MRFRPGFPSLRSWLVLAVLLIAVRAALPFIVKAAINHELNGLPDYSGRVRAVHLGLWRGSCELDGLEITSKDGSGSSFSVDGIGVSVRWRDLLRGAVVGEVSVSRPRADVVLKAPPAPKPPEEKQPPLPKRLAGMVPVRIDRFTVEDGAARLRKLYGKPRVDQSLKNLRLEATNLTNSRKISRTLMAHVRMEGDLDGSGDLRVNGDVDPTASSPTFNMDMSLTGLDLTRLNSLFRQEGGIDLEKGRLSVYAECASADGAFKGYVKPMVKALDVTNKKEKQPTLGKAVKEDVADALARLFRNRRHDTDATRVPFSGRYDDPKVGLWRAVVNAFRNAFIHAITPGVEHSVKLRDATKP